MNDSPGNLLDVSAIDLWRTKSILGLGFQRCSPGMRTSGKWNGAKTSCRCVSIVVDFFSHSRAIIPEEIINVVIRMVDDSSEL